MRQLVKMGDAPRIILFIYIINFIAPSFSRLQRVALSGENSSPGPKVHHRHISSALSDTKVRIGYSPEIYKRQPYGLSITQARKVASWNSGNVIWAYGAQRLLDPALSELVTAESNEPEKGPSRALMLATANMLVTAEMYPKLSGLYGAYTQMIKKHNAPVFMVGVGSQLEFPGGFSLGSARATPAPFNLSGYALHPNQVEFFKKIHESGGVVAVRGKLTEAVCLANSLAPPVVLGCPSLFINHNPTLGDTLLAKWNNILRQRDTENLRLAVGLPHVPHFPSAGQRYSDANILIKFIANNIFKVFPKSFAVFQTPLDSDPTMKRLRNYGVDLGPNRTKYFYDAEHWIEDIRDSADLLFGFRIHGTMSGVAAEVPAIIISTDYRIQELAEEMTLPTATLQDPLFDMKPFNLYEFMAALAFNGSRFDERRRQLAGEYMGIFNRLGLPLNPGIKRIAGLQV